jgi:cysteine desulfurase/selenocysteine lyase
MNPDPLTALDPDLFGPFNGSTWLNAAHQGPLPQAAAAMALEMVAQKQAPATLPDESFFQLPARLRASLGRLIGAPADEVILANSTSYGLDLLAHGLDLKAGDEVLLVDGDFPATITPWLILEPLGVRVRRLTPEQRPLCAEQVAREITPATRALCCSWAFSLTGETIDPAAIGQVCRQRDVTFVLNGSQAVGAQPVDVSAMGIDALVSCGFKWLCGPYATGFCWLTPELRERLTYRQAYWLTQMHGTDLSVEIPDCIRDDQHAEQYDVFCTANFLNFAPWLASIELLLGIGIDHIASHDQRLVQQIINAVEGTSWRLVSPSRPGERSTLVLLEHNDPAVTQATAHALANEGISIAQRAGRLRFSPHLYNTPAEIENAMEIVITHTPT